MNFSKFFFIWKQNLYLRCLKADSVETFVKYQKTEAISPSS